MALEITSVAEMNLKSISSSFFPLNLRQDIEDNLLENNSEYEDCECNSDHVNDRSDIRSVKFKSRNGCIFSYAYYRSLLFVSS